MLKQPVILFVYLIAIVLLENMPIAVAGEDQLDEVQIQAFPEYDTGERAAYTAAFLEVLAYVQANGPIDPAIADCLSEPSRKPSNLSGVSNWAWLLTVDAYEAGTPTSAVWELVKILPKLCSSGMIDDLYPPNARDESTATE